MRLWLTTFYRWMLWWQRFGLTIAQTTGRDPADIQQQRLDIAALSKYLDNLEIQDALPPAR